MRTTDGDSVNPWREMMGHPPRTPEEELAELAYDLGYFRGRATQSLEHANKALDRLLQTISP